MWHEVMTGIASLSSHDVLLLLEGKYTDSRISFSLINIRAHGLSNIRSIGNSKPHYIALASTPMGTLQTCLWSSGGRGGGVCLPCPPAICG